MKNVMTLYRTKNDFLKLLEGLFEKFFSGSTKIEYSEGVDRGDIPYVIRAIDKILS